MADYIEREAALSLVKPDDPDDEKASVTIATAKKLVRYILHHTPAADVAPVVRCENCKYYYRKDMCGGTGWCTAVDVSSFDKHFCSYGEKREEK